MTHPEFLDTLKNNEFPDDDFIKNVAPSVLTFFLQNYTDVRIHYQDIKLSSKLVSVNIPEDDKNLQLVRIAYSDIRNNILYGNR